MALHTLILTVEVTDDCEANEMLERATRGISSWAEVVERRQYRDLDAEVRAALVGVEWGGR